MAEIGVVINQCCPSAAAAPLSSRQISVLCLRDECHDEAEVSLTEGKRKTNVIADELPSNPVTPAHAGMCG